MGQQGRGDEPHLSRRCNGDQMEEVLRTTDPVKLSYAQHLLEEAGIEVAITDQHISAVEGSIGAFPRRIFVHADLANRARDVLKELSSDGAR